MNYEPKNGDFTLFVNKRKEKKNHPDFTGTILLDGKEHWLSMWSKGQDKNGNPWFSGAVGQEKEPRKQENKSLSQQAAPRKPASSDDPDDMIPF